MVSAERAHSWSIYETQEFFWWASGFSVSTRPESLLIWQDAVLEAGERRSVYRIEQMGWAGYCRNRDGDVRDFLHSHSECFPKSDPDLPLGFLLEIANPFVGAPITTSTLLNYLEVDGDVAEEWVTDMHDFGYAIGQPRAFSYPPLIVSTEVDPSEGVVWVEFSTATDIWFPWNHPMWQPGTSVGRLDNRILSRLNGGRLNGFLADVREATLEMGGVWESAVWSDREHPQANEYGVILDAARPPS